jgi:hypothetical protein
MEWDLGIRGLGLLARMSLVFGIFAHLVAARSTTRWVGAIGAGAYFVVGLLVSEAWFGWATEEELQPNIDGLSFDEVLLLATLPCVAAVLVARMIGRRRHAHGPTPVASGAPRHA